MRYLIFLSTMLIVFSCGSAKKSEKAKMKRIFNSAKNELIWSGDKLVGAAHSGNLMFKSVDLVVEDGKLLGGEIVVDMTTLRCTDLEGDMRGKLEGHLASDDFFSIAKFPTAMILLKEVKYTDEDLLQVIGELTIKGITNEIVFIVNEKKLGEDIIYTTLVEVDRTKYDVKYGSANFFQGLGDKAINDLFNLDIQIVLPKS